MHFCRPHKPHMDPAFTLNGAPISVAQDVKFLGLVFDSKLVLTPFESAEEKAQEKVP